VAVLVGSLVMMFTDAPIIDPILSLLIAFFVLFNVYRNIKPAFRIILQGVPGNISEEAIRKLVEQEQEVLDIHDLKLWTLDGEHHVASMHVVVKNNTDLKTAEHLKERIKQQLEALHIAHATIEVEYHPDHAP
jgi:cobalt-zinc-cadmium efflux system protein